MRRRRLLGLLGTAITGGLAGCIGGNGDGDGTSATDTDAGTEPSPTTGGGPATTTGTRTETGTDPRTETATATDTDTSTTAGSTTEESTTEESTTEESTDTRSSTARSNEATTTSEEEATNGTTEQGTGGSSGETRTIEVGPGGRYVFAPGTDEPVEIPAGTTVEWVWRSDLHNIVVDSQPTEADWEGTPGGAGKNFNTGYTYTHTFEVPGEYRYWCEPHRSLGMVADVLVTES